MSILSYAVPFLAGILNAIHSGTNAKLNDCLQRPWWAAIFVCVISGLAVSLGVLVTRERVPNLSSITGTPWWAWVGTAIAGVPVITTLLFAGRLGGAAFNGLVITATLLCSVMLDHFGLFGFATHPVNLWRIIGGLLMLGGVALVCVF
jgi:bacterial/archaeal transporter family-2 protein